MSTPVSSSRYTKHAAFCVPHAADLVSNKTVYLNSIPPTAQEANCLTKSFLVPGLSGICLYIELMGAHHWHCYHSSPLAKTKEDFFPDADKLVFFSFFTDLNWGPPIGLGVIVSIICMLPRNKLCNGTMNNLKINIRCLCFHQKESFNNIEGWRNNIILFFTNYGKIIKFFPSSDLLLSHVQNDRF